MGPRQSRSCPPVEGPAGRTPQHGICGVEGAACRLFQFSGVRRADSELVHDFRRATVAKPFPRWIPWHFFPPCNPASSKSSAGGPGQQRRCNGPLSAARGVRSTSSPVPLRWPDRRISGRGGRSPLKMSTAAFPPFRALGAPPGSPRELKPRSGRSAGRYGRFRGGARPPPSPESAGIGVEGSGRRCLAHQLPYQVRDQTGVITKWSPRRATPVQLFIPCRRHTAAGLHPPFFM